jgi:hypothetical protein
MIHGPRPQFIRPDGKIREPFPGSSSPAIKDHLALAVRGEAVGQSPGGGDFLYCERDLAQDLPKTGANPAAGDPGRPRNTGRTLDHIQEPHMANASHLQVRIQDSGGFHECLHNHGG